MKYLLFGLVFLSSKAYSADFVTTSVELFGVKNANESHSLQVEGKVVDLKSRVRLLFSKSVEEKMELNRDTHLYSDLMFKEAEAKQLQSRFCGSNLNWTKLTMNDSVVETVDPLLDQPKEVNWIVVHFQDYSVHYMQRLGVYSVKLECEKS